jgi:hypothetical protein
VTVDGRRVDARRAGSVVSITLPPGEHAISIRPA